METKYDIVEITRDGDSEIKRSEKKLSKKEWEKIIKEEYGKNVEIIFE